LNDLEYSSKHLH